ncbi:hypothetical protein BWI93_10310 [Siphonobacter sp. BAB-5385]|uniref:hypothetical protein n=1 Tax=Siphonobacter sp. BAB-5385 TaxID=1864822 RepID=UPI000B9EAAF8|nr:hypothetical protein [Siphonobacter sp. BAB-5385]OZI08251.1 hypothetical protein BWI93_10310 [Siphonobacter sp. BAB-5385]
MPQNYSTPDVSSLPQDVMRLVEENPRLITDIVQLGFESLQNDFTVSYLQDESYLYSLTAFDVARVADDDFKPQKASALGLRKAKLQDVDYDFFIPRSQVISIALSHVRKFTDVTDLNAALDNPLALMFLQEVLKAQGSFMRQNGSFKGSRNAAGIGAGSAIDGILKKFSAGVATDEDIPEEHVVTPAAALDDENTYDHVQDLCDAVVKYKEDLLDYPLEFRLSKATKQKYDRNRRAKFPQHVKPGEEATSPDEYSGIKFVTDPGLANKETTLITPKTNLIFGMDSNIGVNKITVKDDMKGLKVNVFFRGLFDYAYGNFVFHNGKY